MPPSSYDEETVDMINVVKGDLFESKAQTLVNTVNCVGVMGNGVALGFKKRFPEMYEDYVRRCNAGEVRLGRPYLYRTLLPPWVLNFPTKGHWRSVTRLSDIVEGLDFLGSHYRDWGIESLAVPPLGCGEGQLEWRVVGPTLYRRLAELDVDVELYAPFNAADAELDPAFLSDAASGLPEGGAPMRVPPAEVALAVILRFIEREPYRWPVGRVTFQKLAYFATRSGLPTGLDFRRGSYGPFAAELKRMESRLINNGLVVERRQGRMLELRTGPTYRDAVAKYKADLETWRTEIGRVADLLLRANTKRAEVLATAHFAANELTDGGESSPSEDAVVDAVLAWKVRRKPALSKVEVEDAVRTLNLLGWITAEPSDSISHDLELAEIA
jgi:O-acetyl-ADP-ribose deacetylase (regulator of RNase III)/uncharacterized protein YwgA